MSVGQSFIALDLHSHRRKMLRFVWVVIGGLLVVAFTLPQVISGREPLFPIHVQALFLSYLILSYVISRWHQYYWLAPHMLLGGLLVMLIATCYTQDGINTPASHFIALLPALCALTMSANAAIVHSIIIAMAIAAITILAPGLQIRDASTMDLLNAATLILNAIIVATGVIYLSRHQEKLISIFRGKSSLDELTGLPNRYFLRNLFWEKTKKAQELDKELPGIISVGIDGFVEYNDANGEEAGDALLIQAANTISSLLPPNQHFSIGRTHGVGFMVIFDHVDDEKLKYVSTKIQTGFKALNIKGLEGNPMTVSIAIVQFPKDNPPASPTSALRLAHQHLIKLQARGPEHLERFTH